MPIHAITRTRTRVAGALAACALAAAPAGAQRTFTSLTMFGDSFSDVGNARALVGPTIPPRFSNGPVWSDSLAIRLGRAGDATPSFVPQSATGVYAVGGAVAVGSGASALTSTQAQIGRWCLSTTVVCNRTADATGLYTLFVGGNDLRAIAGNGALTLAQQQEAARDVARTITTQGQYLVTAGGVRNLLFATLPDLGRTPDRIGTPQSAILSTITTAFNQELLLGIGGLRALNPTARLFDFRLDNLFFNVLTQPAAFGFTNTTGNCIAAGAAPACDGYVFWDGLHPSAKAHGFVASAAYDLVAFDRNVAAVPEPATILLTGGGLAVLGLVARRRRAA